MTLTLCLKLVSLCSLVEYVICGSNVRYSYEEGEGHLSPCKWSSVYPYCAGKAQSPINIPENTPQYDYPPLKFVNFNSPPTEVELVHGLHTVMVKMLTNFRAVLSGGPLKEWYTFDQLHFHWGIDDEGSEHTVANQSFPMEAHLVFYKISSGDFNRAVKEKDGIVVLGVFLRIEPDDNLVYNDIMYKMNFLTEPFLCTRLSTDMTLANFLPQDVGTFYTYRGSLTTPPCQESVIWIIFANTEYVSRYQLMQFRTLYGERGPVKFNRRPIQALNGRQVHLVTGSCAIES